MRINQHQSEATKPFLDVPVVQPTRIPRQHTTGAFTHDEQRSCVFAEVAKIDIGEIDINGIHDARGIIRRNNFLSFNFGRIQSFIASQFFGG